MVLVGDHRILGGCWKWVLRRNWWVNHGFWVLNWGSVTVCRVLMATTACFIIVSRNDIPIYEAEVGSAAKVWHSLFAFVFTFSFFFCRNCKFVLPCEFLLPFLLFFFFGKEMLVLVSKKLGMHNCLWLFSVFYFIVL